MDFAAFPFEIKSLDATGTIEGVISAFGGVDAYGDTIEAGAYTKSIDRLRQAGRKLPVLYHHDPHRPIGVWENLTQTDTALVGTAKLAMEVPDAKSTLALAKMGALTGISIGYNVAPGGSRKDGNTRVLSDIDLMEASIVTFPADAAARIDRVKSIGGARDIEDMLQQTGMSGRKAKAAASAAWKAINASTDDDEAEAHTRAILDASAARIRGMGADTKANPLEGDHVVRPFRFNWS